MSRDSLVILSARRTPVGAFQGVFAGVTAPQLGAVAIQAALSDSGVAPGDVDEVIMGCVLSAGLGQAPARQAALGAGLPASVPSTTVNKMCGSAMRAIMQAGDQILAGSARIMVAGGLESMTNDGLQSPWDGQLMGCFAEATSSKYGFSREAQDEFARESARRSQAAIASGAFANEIAPVTAKTRKGEAVIDKDETPGTIDVSKIPMLKPAFRKDGSVTAASSASISDGAAAVVLTRESTARERGLAPIARILGYTSFAREPEWFTLAPVGAMERLLKQIEWRAQDADLYEINEAFAVVTMAAMKDLSLDHGKVNVNGGACSLGHPIGATGARILTTLLYALKNRGKKRGIASLCIGGGEATAIAVELL
jgi:acetyl-CoA C-acetyltransferase